MPVMELQQRPCVVLSGSSDRAWYVAGAATVRVYGIAAVITLVIERRQRQCVVGK
jgi:hypothetical protein